jgi:hypothetical protein
MLGEIKVTKESKESTTYLLLAKEVCEIIKIHLEPNEPLDSILEKIKIASQTPYMTSTQKEIRKTLMEIIELIEKRKNIKDVERKIAKLKSDVLWDEYWE